MWHQSVVDSRMTGYSEVSDSEELHPSRNELAERKARFGLLVLLCSVQFLAKHFSSPIRYRLRGFTQLAADELRNYAVATAMRCVVVGD